MNSTPALASSSWKVVATETESNTASTATRERVPSPLSMPSSALALADRNAELLVGLENLGIDLVERLRPVVLLGRRVVIEVLVVDRAEIHPRPGRLAHGEPAAIGLEPPGQHPLGLALLGRDEADGVLGQALGGLVGFDQRLEPILILVDVDAANPIDGLLYGRHSSLRCGFKDRGLDWSDYGWDVVSGSPRPPSRSGAHRATTLRGDPVCPLK